MHLGILIACLVFAAPYAHTQETDAVLTSGLLTKHLATERAQAGVLDLNQYTRISDDIRDERIRSYQGFVLLDGLKTFPTQLMPDNASRLKNNDMHVSDRDTPHIAGLSLNGLARLSLLNAYAIQKCIREGGHCRLNGLTKLSVDEARMLCAGNNPGDVKAGTLFDRSRLRLLTLDGLLNLHPPNLVKELARHKGFLSLNGVTALPDKAADVLAKHEGSLCLNGLTSISGRSLSRLLTKTGVRELRHREYGEADLQLNGVVQVVADPPFQDSIVGRFKGTLELNSLPEMDLVLLGSLVKAVEGGLCLDGLTDLTPEAAAVLGNYRGTVTLNGIRELADDAAEHLARHEKVLVLDGLEHLSVVAAEAFAKHQGMLMMNGITTLSDEAATALAAHPLTLSLEGVEKLSESAAKALKANPEILLPEEP